jgi:hypothetical protein
MNAYGGFGPQKSYPFWAAHLPPLARVGSWPARSPVSAGQACYPLYLIHTIE